MPNAEQPRAWYATFLDLSCSLVQHLPSISRKLWMLLRKLAKRLLPSRRLEQRFNIVDQRLQADDPECMVTVGG